MSSTQTTGKPPAKQGDCGCGDYDKDSATQVSINKVRATYCITLYDAKGAVSKLQTKYKGENEVYKEKKSIFINTEDNYRRYRNFDMCAGTEILQANDSIKGNVGKLKDWSQALNTLLVYIAKQTKDLKAKFNDLSDAACKLGRAYDDKCNAAQRKALTGTTKDNCGDPTTVIDPCKNAGTDIEKLICIPTGLAQDADSIFQVSSEVIGVQLFSNIDALDQLQKDLSTKSTVFEKFIND